MHEAAWPSVYEDVMEIIMARRDPSLDTLLDLDGQVLVINEGGYGVKFVVHQVPARADKPHGLDLWLTLRGAVGGRPVGFDNAHPVAGQRRGAAKDHKLLSNRNRALLAQTADTHPESLHELAASTGRTPGNLSRTLKMMERYGLVRVQKGERGKLRPEVPYRVVQLEMTLS